MKEKINIKSIIYGLLMLAWMLTVWNFSSQNSAESSSLSGGILERIFGIQGENIYFNTLEVILRKGAHFTIYFIGSVIAFNFFSNLNSTRKNKYLYAFSFTVLYAITDEFHQTFVSGRSGEIRDVIIDSCGALLFLVLNKMYYSLKKRFKK